MDEHAYFLLALSPVLVITTSIVFSSLSKRLGKEKGYLLGFLFYWTVWYVFVPLSYLEKEGFISLFEDERPLLSPSNWPASALLALITLVTLIMYGKKFIHAPLSLILLSIPLAIINGICEELL